MRSICVLFLFFSIFLNAQDKLFYSNGKIREGIIVSIGKDQIFYKRNDTALVERIAKSELLMAENYKGIRYVFAATETLPLPEANNSVNLRPVKKQLFNSLEFQPLGVFLGRVGIVYEKLNEQGTVGFAVPLIITYDAEGLLLSSADSTSPPHIRSKEINFIGGLDVNFYLGDHENYKFFIGPKFRYGTNMTFVNVEYYTIQTQLGWKFGSPEGIFVQHLCFGYGFAQIISSKNNLTRNIRKYYGMFSFTYRVGLKW